MEHANIESLQRSIDQLLDSLTNSDLDLFLRRSSSLPHDVLIERAAVASALCAARNNEPATLWRDRQSKRLKTQYHGFLDRAIESAARPGAGNLEVLVNELVAAGIVGLPDKIDDLSLHQWTDVPSLEPLHRGVSTWAGIAGVKMHPRLLKTFPTVLMCDVSLEILVPPAQRGAHMSRLQSALIDSEGAEHEDLDALSLWIGGRVANTQPNSGVRIHLEGEVRFETVSRKTGHPSYIHGRLNLEVEFGGDGSVLNGTRGLILDIATACPCTLRYSRLVAIRDLALKSEDGLPPTFTHSQPGVVNLRVSDKTRLPRITFAEMFRAAGTGSHLREAVLKRPDEHDLVERIHRRPQFAEDVVRAVACELAASCDQDALLSIEVDLNESIHPHRARAFCSGKAETFWRNLS